MNGDFEVVPGPRYLVYLVPLAEVDSTMFVDLGRLKAFTGSQNHRIPPGVDLRDYPSLVLWSEQFRALISPAKVAFRANTESVSSPGSKASR